MNTNTYSFVLDSDLIYQLDQFLLEANRRSSTRITRSRLLRELLRYLLHEDPALLTRIIERCRR